MRPIAVYSALRLGMFLAVLVLLMAFGARGILAIVLAAVLSLALSYVVLRRQRESVARAWLAGRDRRAARPGLGEVDAAAEDAAVDAGGGSPEQADGRAPGDRRR